MRTHNQAALLAAIVAGLGVDMGRRVVTRAPEPKPIPNPLRDLVQGETWYGTMPGTLSAPTERVRNRAGERLRRQIAKGMLSVGSKGWNPPLTLAEAGISE